MSYVRAYHYTQFRSALAILTEGVIRLSKPTPSMAAAVWFTTRPTWDPGAGTHVILGGEAVSLPPESIARMVGMARLVTDRAWLTPYAKFASAGGVGLGDMEQLAHSICTFGMDPARRYVSAEDWPLRRCTGAELYLDGQWQPVTAESLKAMKDHLAANSLREQARVLNDPCKIPM